MNEVRKSIVIRRNYGQQCRVLTLVVQFFSPSCNDYVLSLLLSLLIVTRVDDSWLRLSVTVNEPRWSHGLARLEATK